MWLFAESDQFDIKSVHILSTVVHKRSLRRYPGSVHTILSLARHKNVDPDPGSGAFFTPGSGIRYGMGKNQDPG